MDDPRPRVSVVLNFFNEEPFLQEAVDSISSQTFTAWQLLLVDDGSTDGSTNIAKEAALRFPKRVSNFEHEGHVNRGMSASRNLGIKHAQGEFILFLDGDDALTPNALSEQVALMDAHPEVGTIYGPMQRWYSWPGDSDHPLDAVQALHMELDRVVVPSDVVSVFLVKESAVPSGNLFRLETVRRMGGFEEEFTGMYEDQVLRVKICTRLPVYVSGRVWYRYHQHTGSHCAMMVQTNQVHAARARFLLWAERYCRTQGVHDRRIRKALRQALRPYRYPRLTRYQVTTTLKFKRLGWQGAETAKSIACGVLPDSVWQWLRVRLRGHDGSLPSAKVKT